MCASTFQIKRWPARPEMADLNDSMQAAVDLKGLKSILAHADFNQQNGSPAPDVKIMLILFSFCAILNTQRTLHRRETYPMMLRSAASPGSWGRSTGRHIKNGSSCRDCWLVDPQSKAPLLMPRRFLFVHRSVEGKRKGRQLYQLRPRGCPESRIT